MADKPLARQHSLYIEDAVWDNLVEHTRQRGESASRFVNGVVRSAIGMKTDERTQMEHTAAAPTHRPAPEPKTHVADGLPKTQSYNTSATAQQQRDQLLHGVSTKKQR